MFNSCIATGTAAVQSVVAQFAPPSRIYRGPDRRTAALPSSQPPQPSPPLTRWLALMIDEIDHGMLLLNADGELVHANDAAQSEMDATHPLQLRGRRLHARQAQDVATLHGALIAATQRGLRKLLPLGDGSRRVNVAVIPLGNQATLLVLGKQQLSQRLSVQCFATLHGLTPAEIRVLESLCDGLEPRDVAALNGVGLATVRTQIGSIRAKTGADNIRALVLQVAVLPPMRSALRAA